MKVSVAQRPITSRGRFEPASIWFMLRPFIVAAMFFLGSGVIDLCFPDWSAAGMSRVLFYAGIIVSGLWPLVFALSLRRLRRRVNEHGGMLCPGCRYVLSRLPSPGACPECGRPFTVESVREWWRVHYGWEHSDKQQSDNELLRQIARRAGCGKDHESV